MEELDIVTNPSLSVEMLLIRLMYLRDFNKQDFEETIITKNKLDSTINKNEISINRKTIDQMKSISQQDEIKPKLKSNEINNKLLINNFKYIIGHSNYILSLIKSINQYYNNLPDKQNELVNKDIKQFINLLETHHNINIKPIWF